MPGPIPALSKPTARGPRQFSAEDIALMHALAVQFPSPDDAISELATLRAKLGLPKGVVNVISDVHGEYAKLRHVINNASGALRPLVDELFGKKLSPAEIQDFLAVLYYPAECITKLSPSLTDPATRRDWVLRTLGMQFDIARVLARSYRRRDVRNLMPVEFQELFAELLAETPIGGSGRGPAYTRSIIESMGEHGHDFGAVRAASRLVRNLSVKEIVVAGDLGDRGPRIDRVIDYLMRQPCIDLVWGNHDTIWMGACLGHEACMFTTLRFSARYRRAAQLEEGYGILTTPLERLVRECYNDDPAEHFKPKGDGWRDPVVVARMQKAIAIMQFKAEGQLIQRRPEWNLEHRNLLHRIDHAKGTVTIDGVEHPLLDKHLPTIDPKDPYAYSAEERVCLDRIRASFVSSQKLWDHMSWVVKKGGMWLTRDDALIFHACVPVEKDGTPQKLAVDGRELAGRELMDALAGVVRRCFRKAAAGLDSDADWLWYLWGGPRSPLFGKDKLASFESYFVADKKAREEHKNPYFELIHDAEFTRKIGRLFGCGDDVLVVNGHVPVKVEKGEQPVKRGGNAVTIDGAFSEAYGDRGYTLILAPDAIKLAEHSKFESVEQVISSGADIVPKVTTIRAYPKPHTVGDTQEGAEIRRRIDDLEMLIAGYEEGVIAS